MRTDGFEPHSRAEQFVGAKGFGFSFLGLVVIWGGGGWGVETRYHSATDCSQEIAPVEELEAAWSQTLGGKSHDKRPAVAFLRSGASTNHAEAVGKLLGRFYNPFWQRIPTAMKSFSDMNT